MYKRQVSMSLSGFFTFESQYQLSEEDVETLITKNGIAITTSVITAAGSAIKKFSLNLSFI